MRNTYNSKKQIKLNDTDRKTLYAYISGINDSDYKEKKDLGLDDVKMP